MKKNRPKPSGFSRASTLRVPSRLWIMLAACCALPALPGCTPVRHHAQPFALVRPAAETEATLSPDDAADDPAIWVYPTDPSLSLVFGSDKDAGVGVYALSGERLSFEQVGSINNIDVVTMPAPDGEAVHLLGGTAVDANAVYFWSIDTDTRTITRVDAGGVVSTLPDVYGFALAAFGYEVVALTTSKAGLVEVLRIAWDKGVVRATPVATVPVGTQLEGVVADPLTMSVFVGEEGVGIWRYDLPRKTGGRPDWARFGSARRLVDTCADTQGRGHLISDVEGLAIWAPDRFLDPRNGYLIASSQGDDRYAVYERAHPNKYVGSFRIAGRDGIDGTTHTDGIAACAQPIGPAFPLGLFIAQDDDNAPETQNFKLVDWREIKEAIRRGR